MTMGVLAVNLCADVCHHRSQLTAILIVMHDSIIQQRELIVDCVRFINRHPYIERFSSLLVSQLR